MTAKRSLVWIGVLALSALGCRYPSLVEEQMGVATREHHERMIANPDAGEEPDSPEGIDGETAQTVMKRFRKEQEKPVSTVPRSMITVNSVGGE